MYWIESCVTLCMHACSYIDIHNYYTAAVQYVITIEGHHVLQFLDQLVLSVEMVS